MKKIMLIILVCGIAAASYTQQLPVLGEKQASVVNEIFDESIAGTTFYDVQAYRLLQNRIYAYPDGSVGAVWMISEETTNWTDRGTGYNYYSGISWGPEPTVRLESVKTGFPCYALYGANGEITVSHYLPGTEDGTLLFHKRSTAGSGSWESFTLEGPEAGLTIYTPAMVTNGQDNMNLHVLASVWPEYMGMSGTVLYSRSTDGGETWDILHHFFDEIDGEVFSSLGGDVFTWAQPRGDTIAFSVGFEMENAYIMKSFDNGDNWERIDVYENPYSPYAGGAIPPFCAGDCSHALALDSDGNCHVVFGRMIYQYDEEGNTWYYRETEGVVYWNETMETLDTTILSTYTLEYLIAGGNLIGWTIPHEGDSSILDIARYHYNGMTTSPQINIDDNDNIYVIWSAVARGFDNLQYNYRHICGTGSADGGMTWSPIKDYNLDSYYLFKECVFPSMSPSFYGDKVHFMFQCDPEPGMYVYPPETHAQANPTENEFILMQVPTDNFLVGIDEPGLATQPTLDVSAIFPNPFTETTTFSYTLLEPSDVSINIFNPQGQLIKKIEQEQSKGEQKVRWNAEGLPAGMYYFRIQAGDKVGGGKMVKISDL